VQYFLHLYSMVLYHNVHALVMQRFLVDSWKKNQINNKYTYMLFVHIILFFLISIAQAELKTKNLSLYIYISQLFILSCMYTFILVVHRVIYDFHIGGMRFIISLNLDYYCLFVLCVYFIVFSILRM
jgi:hypothetical protein